MCSTTGDTGGIIILSDDDDGEDVSCVEPSVLIVEVEVEDVKGNVSDVVVPLDEDLIVTFSRRGEVLPHARYDCTVHEFTATDCETKAPVASNQLFCDQCFCYICDKLASLCEMWCHSGTCHCNSHKRSDFWNNLRKDVLLGYLKNFNLTLLDVDTHLREADMLLQSFRRDLSKVFSTYIKGNMLQKYGPSLPKQQGVVHDYTPVFQFVSLFLTRAEGQNPRAAAVMRLGATEEFLQHSHVSGNFLLQSPMANPAQAKLLLLQRVIASLQRQVVMGDLTPAFTDKLQGFYKKLNFPSDLKSMRNSLCVRPWDDVLLVSVMKGQNVLGFRKDKGRKDVLVEQISVVRLRTELLQQQRRYKELCRYLQVILSDEPAFLQQLRDLIPFFKSMDGDLTSAVHSMFPSVKAPVARLTPPLFAVYLRIFETATAPKLVASHPLQLCCSDATWEPIKDAAPLKRAELVKFALRTQRLCSAVFFDSQCWSHLLSIANTRAALPPPNHHFLHEARFVVNSLLQNLDGSNILISRNFQEAYPDQSLLLLVTGALSWRIFAGPLSPALPLLNTYKENMWAVEWLWESLGLRLQSFLLEITQEVENTKDRPVAGEASSQVKALSQLILTLLLEVKNGHNRHRPQTLTKP